MLIQVLYDKIADLVGNPKVPVVLVGNKKDLEVKIAKNMDFGPKQLDGNLFISRARGQ